MSLRSSARSADLRWPADRVNARPLVARESCSFNTRSSSGRFIESLDISHPTAYIVVRRTSLLKFNRSRLERETASAEQGAQPHVFQQGGDGWNKTLAGFVG